MNNPQFPVYRTTDPKAIDRIMRKINAHLRHCARLPFPPHLNEDKTNLTRHLNNYRAYYLNSNHRWTAYRIAVVEKKNTSVRMPMVRIFFMSCSETTPEIIEVRTIGTTMNFSRLMKKEMMIGLQILMKINMFFLQLNKV